MNPLSRSIRALRPLSPASRSGATAFVALLLVTPPAQAYLDPGTGSILLQGLIAAVAAVLTWAGFYWQKLKSFFRRKPPSVAAKEEADHGAPPERESGTK